MVKQYGNYIVDLAKHTVKLHLNKDETIDIIDPLLFSTPEDAAKACRAFIVGYRHGEEEIKYKFRRLFDI